MISNAMPQTGSPVTASRKRSRWPKIVFLVVFLIAVGSVIQTVRLQGELNKLKSPQASNQDQVQKALEQVSKLMVLPQNETPTLATVSDLSKLKDQPFFANAAIGDQVIIYTNSKKAILWRPSVNKIIEIAPINLNDNQTAAVNTPVSASESPSVTPSPSTKPKKP